MTTMKTDPELQKIFDKRGWPQTFLPTIEKIPLFRKRSTASTARFAVSETVQAFLKEHQIKCSQKDLDIPVRDGQVRGRLYIPKGTTDRDNGHSFALFVMFHGGGYCLGGLDTEEVICQILCSELRIAVLNIEYRLAPEHPFPTGVSDCIDASQWASQNTTGVLHCDLSKGFIVGGISGGAAIAAAIAHTWKLERRSPPITGSFMSLAILDDVVPINGRDVHIAPDEYRSQSENAEAPLLNKALSDYFWAIYDRDRASQLGNPLLFESFEGLPRTYLQTCGLDPYRDGTKIYQRRITEAGGEARLDLYDGLPHQFWTVYPELSATKRWLNDSIAGTAWLLGSQGPRSLDSKL